jgi:glycosyltransferase involved in cell wall biosynthesis
MRVLFLSAANSIHTLRWVNALAVRGHEIHLAYCKNHAVPQSEWLHKDVRLHPLPFAAPLGYYLNAPTLRNLSASLDCDLCNAHYASGYGTLARRAKAKPLVLSVWGSDVYIFPFQSARNMALIRKNLAYTDYIASTGRNMADQVKKLGCALKNEITITPFGIDLESWGPVKTEYEPAADAPLVIGTMKTLRTVYGIDTLIRSFALLTQQGYAAVLQIYGDGPEKSALQELSQELGVAGRVSFGGAVVHKDVPGVMRGMDVFACFSRSESFGVVALEAMASGVPVVATRTEGFCEVLSDGETALLGPIDEAPALAALLEKLLKDAPLREKMGGRGRARVEALYNWKDNVATMEELYLQACK